MVSQQVQPRGKPRETARATETRGFLYLGALCRDAGGKAGGPLCLHPPQWVITRHEDDHDFMDDDVPPEGHVILGQNSSSRNLGCRPLPASRCDNRRPLCRLVPEQTHKSKHKKTTRKGKTKHINTQPENYKTSPCEENSQGNGQENPRRKTYHKINRTGPGGTWWVGKLSEPNEKRESLVSSLSTFLRTHQQSSPAVTSLCWSPSLLQQCGRRCEGVNPSQPQFNKYTGLVGCPLNLERPKKKNRALIFPSVRVFPSFKHPQQISDFVQPP